MPTSTPAASSLVGEACCARHKLAVIFSTLIRSHDHLQAPSAADQELRAASVQALHVAFSTASLPAGQSSNSSASGLRLEVDAPFPSFISPVGTESKRKRTPISAQQAIDEVKVTTAPLAYQVDALHFTAQLRPSAM